MEENKEILENAEEIKEEAVEAEAQVFEEPKKDIDVKEVINSIFSTPEKIKGKDGDVEVKRPVNIFSKPIPVTQDETARKQRLKMVIIEGLLFGAFLTAITAIYSLSGLELKLDPENGTNTPSVWFFLIEFVFYSVLVGVGDYFLTEKRVNNYNAKMASVVVDLDDEIANALAEQEADGLTAEEVAAQNKSNGEEEKKAFIEVTCTAGEDSLTDKSFSASIDGEASGSLTTEKAVIVDTNGFETIILKITKLEAADSEFKNGVVMELLNAAKAAAGDNGLAAIAIAKSVYGGFNELSLSDGEKFKVTYSEPIKLQEAYPGALMGVSGEMK